MIKALCKSGSIEWTQHAMSRMDARGIEQHEVEDALLLGEAIETYPNDTPYPSYLILGKNGLHVVCGIGLGRLWIITAYRPSSDKWEEDLKTRKEAKK